MTEIQEKDWKGLTQSSFFSRVKYRKTHEGSPYPGPGSVLFTFKPKSETCVWAPELLHEHHVESQAKKWLYFYYHLRILTKGQV